MPVNASMATSRTPGAVVALALLCAACTSTETRRTSGYSGYTGGYIPYSMQQQWQAPYGGIYYDRYGRAYPYPYSAWGSPYGYYSYSGPGYPPGYAPGYWYGPSPPVVIVRPPEKPPVVTPPPVVNPPPVTNPPPMTRPPRPDRSKARSFTPSAPVAAPSVQRQDSRPPPSRTTRSQRPD